jgi:hypothetical protein
VVLFPGILNKDGSIPTDQGVPDVHERVRESCFDSMDKFEKFHPMEVFSSFSMSNSL